MNDKYDPVKGDVVPVFFHYTIPSVIAMLAMSSAFMIDGIFVGNYVGASALAAVNLSLPVWSALFAVISMLAIGGSVMAGSYLGENNPAAASNIFAKAMATSLLFALVISISGLLLIDQLVLALGANESLVGLVSAYLKIILIFSPGFLMGAALFYFVKVDGNPLLASGALIITALLNIALNWLFIVNMGMGIEGAAYATGIAESTTLLMLLCHFFTSRATLKFTSLTGSWRKVFTAMINGFSEFANEISIGLTALLFNWVMISKAGVEGVAALTIVNYLFFIGVIIFYGIGESLQPLVSKNLGARQSQKIAGYVTAALISTMLTALALCTILIVLPEFLIGLFLKPEETATLEIAKEFITYFWPAFLFSGFNITLTEYFTACQKPAYSAAIAVSRSLVLPCILLLTLPLWLGDIGIYIAIPVAELLTCLMAVLFAVKNLPEQMVTNHQSR
jgi:putative MATE family efflux protein|tara:strand:- start:4824 stop:6176 length:1353 start_codon:yes stop_codon:yes gene_type:complete